MAPKGKGRKSTKTKVARRTGKRNAAKKVKRSSSKKSSTKSRRKLKRDNRYLYFVKPYPKRGKPGIYRRLANSNRNSKTQFVREIRDWDGNGARKADPDYFYSLSSDMRLQRTKRSSRKRSRKTIKV